MDAVGPIAAIDYQRLVLQIYWSPLEEHWRSEFERGVGCTAM